MLSDRERLRLDLFFFGAAGTLSMRMGVLRGGVCGGDGGGVSSSGGWSCSAIAINVGSGSVGAGYGVTVAAEGDGKQGGGNTN